MKGNFLHLLLVGIVLGSCSRIPASSNDKDSDVVASTKAGGTTTSTGGASSIPYCIQKRIDSIKSKPVWNPPAEIHEYEYQGAKVYVMSAPCCDFPVTAVDANCNYICAPSGGFTGRGDNKCPEFFSEAKRLRLVWKDEREK